MQNEIINNMKFNKRKQQAIPSAYVHIYNTDINFHNKFLLTTGIQTVYFF